MLVVAPILALLLVSLVMTLLNYSRRGAGYQWLLAVGGMLLAWPLILLTGLRLPLEGPSVAWGTGDLLSSSPSLLADSLSWPYATALVTLGLAVVMTDVAHVQEADPSAWRKSLLFTSLGLLSVYSGNPLTLLLTWTAIDLVEIFILLGLVLESRARERVVIAFSAKVVGSGLLVAAMLVARAAGEELTFSRIPSISGLLLLLAAGLRLGVLPLHLPFLRDLPLRRGLGTILRLVPVAAALVLLARTAAALSTAVEPLPYSAILLFLGGLAALYAGAAWTFAPDELAGRPAWLLGMASLAVAAALRGLPSASLAWGMAGLYSGGLLFLSSARGRWLNRLTLLGMVGFCTLPYTPAWEGARLFGGPFQPVFLLFLLALALLLFGYAWHTLRPGAPLAGVERWVRLIYPLGLALLPVTHIAIGLRRNLGLGDMPQAGWWVGAAALLLFGLGVLWSERGPRIPREPVVILDSILSLEWLYRGFWAFFRASARLVAFITVVFEGEGGLLWSLLVLVLLMALIMRSAGG